MHQEKNKRIFIYFLLFLILGTTHNYLLKEANFLKLENIKVIGLEKNENDKIKESLLFLNLKSLVFIKKYEINEILKSNSLVETYSVFRKFPSTLEVRIKKTNILANTLKNNIIYQIGSNGKLIETDKKKDDLPFVFGSFKNHEFLELKKIIDESKLEYQNIKNIYFFNSGRWDIETHDNILIKLPLKKIINSLNISKNLILNENFKNLKIIDLRVENQVILNE